MTLEVHKGMKRTISLDILKEVWISDARHSNKITTAYPNSSEKSIEKIHEAIATEMNNGGTKHLTWKKLL